MLQVLIQFCKVKKESLGITLDIKHTENASWHPGKCWHACSIIKTISLSVQQFWSYVTIMHTQILLGYWLHGQLVVEKLWYRDIFFIILHITIYYFAFYVYISKGRKALILKKKSFKIIILWHWVKKFILIKMSNHSKLWLPGQTQHPHYM